jgi:membrane protease YdiL (CAAX protease family)
MPTESVQGRIVLLVGTFAPSLVALGLATRDEGAAGRQRLLDRVTRWQVPVGWYGFAAGYFAAVKIVVALIHRAAFGAWPRFGDMPLVLIPFAIAVSTPVQAGEEVGWRGYALPRLAARMGLARASLVLGVIWAVWHLPLFFLRWGDTYGQSFVVFVLQVTALSVAMAWLWMRTGGSLLLTMLLHAAVNNSKDIVPSAVAGASDTFTLHASNVAWLTVALLWACAAYFLVALARADARGRGSTGR